MCLCVFERHLPKREQLVGCAWIRYISGMCVCVCVFVCVLLERYIPKIEQLVGCATYFCTNTAPIAAFRNRSAGTWSYSYDM